MVKHPTLFSLVKDFIYLFKRSTERERQRHRQREKQAPCREPDVGLDPRTLGSHPEPKADAQPLSHSGVLKLFSLKVYNSNFLQLVSTYYPQNNMSFGENVESVSGMEIKFCSVIG